MNLLSLNFLLFKNRVSNLTGKEEAKIIFTFVFLFFFLAFLYYASYYFLSLLKSFPLIGDLILMRFLEFILLIVFMMLVFSSLLTSFPTIYLSKDLDFLLACPIKFEKVFLMKSSNASIQASWMVVMMFLPIIFAFSHVNSLGLKFLFSFFLSFLPYLFIGTSVGIITSLFLTYLFPVEKVRDISLVFVVGIGSLVYVAFRLLEPEKLANPLFFEEAMQYFAYLKSPLTSFFPSWIIMKTIKSYLKGDVGGYLFYCGMIYVISLLLIAVMVFVSKMFYYKGLISKKSSSRRETKIKIGEMIKNEVIIFFLKEWRNFFRDSKQYSQFLLIGALMVVYIFSLLKLPILKGYLTSLVVLINITSIGLILSALSLRFFFPLMSVEGNNVWIIYSSPLKFSNVVLAKFLFTLIFLFLIGNLLVIISNYFLKVGTFLNYFSIFSISIISICLAAFSVGIGVIFPNFKFESISHIQASLGGIIFMIISTLYLFISCFFILLSALRKIFIYKFSIISSEVMTNFIIFCLFSLILSFLSLNIACKNMKKYQII